MATVGLPLTGAGDATAQVAVDLIGTEVYQRIKLHDGTDGSTLAIVAKATTPGAADGGMVVRPIGSTAFSQAVVGAVGLTSGSSQVGITSGSSAVELTSAGSTRLVGRVDVNNPTTAVSLSSQHTVTIGNPTTAVTVSSGVVLGAGSSANMLGQVQATGTTKVDVSSGVVLGAGSTANLIGSVGVSSASIIYPPGVLTTGAAARVASSVDVSLLSSNTARLGCAIFNETTGSLLYIGFSTALVSSAAYSYQIPAGQGIVLGVGGNFPNYVGMIRGRLQSTTINGIAVVTPFTT